MHTPSNKPSGLAELCTGALPRREPHLRVCAVGPEQCRLPVCLFKPWTGSVCASTTSRRSELHTGWGGWMEEGVVVVVVVVVVKDGIEMRGGKGRLGRRSEMLFPQNSGLIISPLWSVRFGFSPRSAAEQLPVWLHVCVCVCVWLYVWTTQNTKNTFIW